MEFKSIKKSFAGQMLERSRSIVFLGSYETEVGTSVAAALDYRPTRMWTNHLAASLQLTAAL